MLCISAARDEGFDDIKALIEEMLREDKIYIERVLSYDKAGIIQLIRKQGELVSEEYVPEGIAIKAYVPMEVYGKNRLAGDFYKSSVGSRLRFPEITSFDVSVMCAYADFLSRAMINETSRLLLRSRVCLSLLSIKSAAIACRRDL